MQRLKQGGKGLLLRKNRLVAVSPNQTLETMIMHANCQARMDAIKMMRVEQRVPRESIQDRVAATAGTTKIRKRRWRGGKSYLYVWRYFDSTEWYRPNGQVAS